MQGLTERLYRLEQKINHRFDRLENFLTSKFNHMANELDNLKAAAARETSLEQSAIVLLQNLSSMLKSAPDMAAVQTIADQLNANADGLAAAITANTPAAPAANS